MLDTVVVFDSKLDAGHIVQTSVQTRFVQRLLKIETGGALNSPALLLWGMP
jgi:hypothetical protein